MRTTGIITLRIISETNHRQLYDLQNGTQIVIYKNIGVSCILGGSWNAHLRGNYMHLRDFMKCAISCVSSMCVLYCAFRKIYEMHDITWFPIFCISEGCSNAWYNMFCPCVSCITQCIDFMKCMISCGLSMYILYPVFLSHRIYEICNIMCVVDMCCIAHFRQSLKCAIEPVLSSYVLYFAF